MEDSAEHAEESSQRCPFLSREIDFEISMEEISNKLMGPPQMHQVPGPEPAPCSRVTGVVDRRRDWTGRS